MAQWTQADADAIRQALATGTLTVAFADRATTFRSLDELAAILRMIDSSVNPSGTPGHRLGAVRKGV